MPVERRGFGRLVSVYGGRAAPEAVFQPIIAFLIKLQGLQIFDVAIHDADGGTDGMQFRDALGRAAGAVVEIARIGLQRLPEYHGVRLEISGLVRAGRNAAEATDRSAHYVTRHLL